MPLDLPARTLRSLVLPKCRFCSKHRHPREFIAGPVSGMCLYCAEWTKKQHEALISSNPVPHGCDECRRTYDELVFALVRKDGVMQWLCLDCDGAYVRKRKDYYGGTPYGAQLNF
jgi:hypothetical protein